MTRAVSAFALACALLALHVSTVGATDPSPCPTTTSASGARVTCPAVPPTDPNQAAYAQLRTRLGGDLSTALTNQERLTAALHRTSRSVEILSDQISSEEAVISSNRRL